MDRITHQSPRQRGYGSTSGLRNDSLKHTRKHERRKGGIESRSKARSLWRTVRLGSVDRPRWAARTVRPATADRPCQCRGPSGLPRGPSVKSHRTNRSNPRTTERPRGARGLSARHPRTVRPLLRTVQNSVQPKTKIATDRNERRAKHEEHGTNPSGADRPPGPRGPSARCGQSRKRPTPKVNSPKSSSDFPNG
jgi:hypothetical protein